MIKVKLHFNNTWLEESGYTNKEQEDLYEQSLNDVMDNTRWYLDNLDYISEYKVYFGNYYNKNKKGTKSITIHPKARNIYK